MKHKYKILVVDDERNTRNGLLQLLKYDYDVTLAEDGEVGINLLKRNVYDIVLTDLRMPGQYNGLSVLEATKKRDVPPPCIVFTAFGSVESAVEAMKVGAFDFVQKPVNYDRLEILLKRALESRELKQENKVLKEKLSKQKSG
jgi:DNA-binding NtrC family response regulator